MKKANLKLGMQYSHNYVHVYLSIYNMKNARRKYTRMVFFMWWIYDYF